MKTVLDDQARCKNPMYDSTKTIQTVSAGISALLICAVLNGCSQAAPLSITLLDKKTGAVQKCTARESSGKDTAALSVAVEMCARQLEARGYHRISEDSN